MIQGEGIQGVPILDRAAAERGVIEADTIDEKEVLPAGEAADKWRAVAVGGFLYEHARGVAEGVGKGADRVPAGLEEVQHGLSIQSLEPWICPFLKYCKVSRELLLDVVYSGDVNEDNAELYRLSFNTKARFKAAAT